MAFYRTGTITLTNGLLTVTGAGTDFIGGALVGECVQAPDGKLYEIAAITSSTGLTLGQAYLGATAAGQTYAIVPTQSYIRDLASQAATLINSFGAVQANALVVTAADKTSIVDADKLGGRDSVSGQARLFTWTGIKAAIATLINGGTLPGSFTTLSASNLIQAAGGFRSDGAGGSTSITTTGGDSNFQVQHPTSGPVRLLNSGVHGYAVRNSANTTDLALINSSGLAVTGGISATNGAAIRGPTAGKWTISESDSLSGLLTVGDQGAGGSLAVNTASLNDSFPSGLLVDGVYNSESAKSTIQIKALGVKSGGPYHSEMAFHTSSQGADLERMRLSSTGLAVTGGISSTESITQGSTRPVVLSGGSIALRNEIAGGWAQGLNITSNNGAIAVGGFGAFGGAAAAAEWSYIAAQGQDYSSATVKVTPTKLSVTGALSASGEILTSAQVRTSVAGGGIALRMGNSFNTVSLGSIQNATSDADLGFYTQNSVERMRLDAAGNLGLGVVPSAWHPAYRSIGVGQGAALTSEAGFPNSYLSVNAHHDSSLVWRYKATEYATFYRQQTGSHSWYTAPSGTAGQPISFNQAMTLDASGNLLLGTSSVSSLPNNGFIFNKSNGIFYVGHITGSASGAQYVGFLYGGASIGSITQSGTTAVLYNTTSDARLKTNITDSADASSLIDALQVRQFDWKSDNSHQRYGFVAQELYEVAPEAVSKPQDPEEMMAVDYSKLVPMLVLEIQSLRARVAALEPTPYASYEQYGMS